MIKDTLRQSVGGSFSAGGYGGHGDRIMVKWSGIDASEDRDPLSVQITTDSSRIMINTTARGLSELISELSKARDRLVTTERTPSSYVAELNIAAVVAAQVTKGASAQSVAEGKMRRELAAVREKPPVIVRLRPEVQLSGVVK